MTGRLYLNYLKTLPYSNEILWSYNVKEIVEAATAWAMSSPIIDARIMEAEMPIEDADRRAVLWSGVSFNVQRLQMNSRKFISETMMSRMMQANLIYPDGTYNVEAVRMMIAQEEMSDD